MTYQDCEVGTVPLWLGSSLEVGMVWDGPVVNEENGEHRNIGALLVTRELLLRSFELRRAKLQGKSAAQRDPFFLQDWHFDLTKLVLREALEAHCRIDGLEESFEAVMGLQDGFSWISDKLILENLWISWSCCQTVAFRG